MTKLLDHAIETVRGLPVAIQDDLALALLRLAGGTDDAVVRLAAEDRAALEAADAEMRTLWTTPIP